MRLQLLPRHGRDETGRAELRLLVTCDFAHLRGSRSPAVNLYEPFKNDGDAPPTPPERATMEGTVP
jgi:hypothetical protein